MKCHFSSLPIYNENAILVTSSLLMVTAITLASLLIFIQGQSFPTIAAYVTHEGWPLLTALAFPGGVSFITFAILSCLKLRNGKKEEPILQPINSPAGIERPRKIQIPESIIQDKDSASDSTRESDGEFLDDLVVKRDTEKVMSILSTDPESESKEYLPFDSTLHILNTMTEETHEVEDFPSQCSNEDSDFVSTDQISYPSTSFENTLQYPHTTEEPNELSVPFKIDGEFPDDLVSIVNNHEAVSIRTTDSAEESLSFENTLPYPPHMTTEKIRDVEDIPSQPSGEDNGLVSTDQISYLPGSNKLLMSWFPRIIESLKGVLEALITAEYLIDGKGKTKKEDPDLKKNLDGIKHSIEFFQTLLENGVKNPKKLLAKLLENFTLDISLNSLQRRYIAAMNFGTEEQWKVAKETYYNALKKMDYSAFAAFMEAQQPQKFLEDLPGLLKDHFFIEDEYLKSAALNLLQSICQSPNLKDSELMALLKNEQKEKNPRIFLQNVVSYLFESSSLKEEELQQIYDPCVERLLKIALEEKMRTVLQVVARNLRLFSYLFEPKSDDLDSRLDMSFLTSESFPCVVQKNHQEQEDVLLEQNQINKKRKRETRIALLHVPNGMDSGLIVQPFFDRYQKEHPTGDRKKYERELEKLGCNIRSKKYIAVPCPMNDHPLKKIKAQETILKYSPIGAIGKNVILPIIFTFIKLPKISGVSEEELKGHIQQLIGALLPAICHGAFKNSAFRTTFEKIFSEQTTQIANQLETMAQKAISWEDLLIFTEHSCAALTQALA